MNISEKEVFFYKTLKCVGNILRKALEKQDVDAITDDIAEALQHIPYLLWDAEEITHEED